VAWSHFIALFNRNPGLAIAALSAALLWAVVYVAWYATALLHPPAPPERVSMVYFYDQNSGELFEVPAGLGGPMTTSTGSFRGMPAGVRAIVFSCGRCGDANQRFIGWLEAPSTAIEASGRSLPSRPLSFDEDLTDSTLVIRTPDDDRWHYFDSETGSRIVQRAHSRCTGGGALKYCEPPRRLVRDVDPVLLRAARRALTGVD
jgi:hypothetical protein